MDFPIKHWAPFPRRFPSALPVVSADVLAPKRAWVHSYFGTCNFSLILRGHGEYYRQGKLWKVESPCVIAQWPEEPLDYGPLEGTWDELHIDYDAATMPKLIECGLIDVERPVWPIHDLASVNAQIAELEILTKSHLPESVVDRVDRVCERLILETWIIPPITDPAAQSIQALLLHLRQDLAQPIDIEHEAAKRGMSPATFRRRWAQISDVSPSQYLIILRMREACRLLVETSLPVNEIGHTVGFDDEFYFSRRFRKEFQMPPREYRKAYYIRRAGR
ncbi:MAG: helix-turn-helix transcriptional regulator [Chthoniobacteraceae bacterium]